MAATAADGEPTVNAATTEDPILALSSAMAPLMLFSGAKAVVAVEFEVEVSKVVVAVLDEDRGDSTAGAAAEAAAASADAIFPAAEDTLPREPTIIGVMRFRFFSELLRDG
jgi:hypothetical protein